MLSELLQPIKSELAHIHSYCIATEQTIAVAESVTAGCLQLLLSAAPSAQQFFQGGLTAYNCAQKAVHLNVEPIISDSCNGVSPEIAITMARSACRAFRSRIGIGITGYATKVPEENIERLYAFAAIIQQEKTIYSGEIVPQGEGIDAQWDYAVQLIRQLARTIDDL